MNLPTNWPRMKWTQILFLLGLGVGTWHGVTGDLLPSPETKPPPTEGVPHIPIDLARSHFFTELMSWYELGVAGWIKRENTLYESILKRALADDPVLMSYFLDPLNNQPMCYDGSHQYRDTNTITRERAQQESREPSVFEQPESYEPDSALPFCSSTDSAPRLINTNVNSEVLNLKSALRDNLCHFVESDPFFERYLICNSQSITAMPNLPVDTILDLFELSGTQVQVIPEYAFWNNSVRSIRINNNLVTVVDPKAFSGCSSTTLIQMMHNDLKWVWFDGGFEGLEQLVTLQLDFNKITLVGYDSFCKEKEVLDDIPMRLPNLRVLSLRQNPLKLIPRTLFAPFRNSKVNYLVLDGCGLASIHPEALTFLPKLTELELGENPELMGKLLPAFRALAKKTVVPKLKELGLSQNGLSAPDPSIFVFAESLETLNLYKNNLVSLGKASFPSQMPNLKNLNLGACNLDRLESGVFNGMPNLEVLMLNGNHFVQIPAPIGSLNRLLTLDLADNEVEDEFGQAPLKIPRNFFAHLEKLNILVLTNTEIRGNDLDAEQLAGLVKLRLLFLNSCKLNHIHDFTFTSTPALTVLNLSGNDDMESPNSNTFYGLAGLETLYMNFTGFKISDNPAFPMPTPNVNVDATKAIDFVTTGGVFLEQITAQLQEGLGLSLRPFKYLNRLSSLYMFKNDMGYLDSRTFDDLPLLRTLVLSSNGIGIWRKPVFTNNKQLKNIFLDGNWFHSVTEDMLSDFSQKPEWPALGPKVIDLSGNQFQCDLGVCQMKQGHEEGRYELYQWDIPDAYQCLMDDESLKQNKINIPELTAEYCQSLLPIVTDPPTTAPEPTETTTTENRVDDSTKPVPKGSEEDFFYWNDTTMRIVISIGTVCFLMVIIGSLYVAKSRLPNLLFNMTMKRHGRNSSENSAKYDYDVFISYSQQDSDFIQELVPELEGTGKLMGDGRHELAFDMDAASTCSSTASLGLGSAVNETLRVCLHLRDFQVGAPISENIVECVDRSRKVLIVISKSYLESQWCLFEMNLAYHRLVEGRRSSIVLILLESIPYRKRTKVLSHLMKSRTYLEWPANATGALEKRVFWKRLKVALKTDAEED